MTAFPPLGRIVTVAFSLSRPKYNPGFSGAAFLRHTGRTIKPEMHSQSPRTCSFHLNSHSAVVSPTASAIPMSESFPSDFPLEASISPAQSSASLSKLCALLDATPEDLVRLESSSDDGIRGVYLNRSVKKGDIILSVPLSSCLQDDDPPEWMAGDTCSDSMENSDESSVSYRNPSDWATRLSASLLDLQFRGEPYTDLDEGQSVWLSMLPDPTFLRAALPVHWTDDTLSKARSTALELATDSSYFARAQAVEDLMAGLGRCELVKHLDDEDLRSMCHNALDLVQTRTCRVDSKDGVQWGHPLRILAPVFDFINHGSRMRPGDGSANAFFGLEGGEVSDLYGPSLVVRADKDLEANEEVLIDYGESARPAWRCLASYGFVPEYKDGDDDVAEVYMNGVRFEVGSSTVPFEMVETVAASIQDGETIGGALRHVDRMLDGSFHNNEQFESDYVEYDELSQHSVEDADSMLSPAVAVKIAKRLSDVGFQLLLDPEDSDTGNDEDAALNRSTWLAASLRWSQHRILLACAMGLRDWVTLQR